MKATTHLMCHMGMPDSRKGIMGPVFNKLRIARQYITYGGSQSLSISSITGGLVILLTAAAWADNVLDVTSEELVGKHRGLTEFGSFRVSIEADISLGDDRKLQPMMHIEWTHVDQSDRFKSKTFVGFNTAKENPKAITFEHPIHRELSFSDQEARLLRNWDPKKEVELPLKPGGRDASEFATIKGQMYPIDPTAPPTSPALFWLLFNPDIIHDFSTYIRNASKEAVSVSSDDNQPVIEIATPEGLQRFTLSPSHNYLLSRAQWYDADGNLLTEVIIRDFIKTENGGWFPSRSVVKQHGTIQIRAHVEEAIFNESISLKDATVQFPPGARVDDRVRNVIHIWGSDGKPLHTFAEYEKYATWASNAARLNAPKGARVSNAAGPFSSTMLIWTNVALVATVILLFVIRKRLV